MNTFTTAIVTGASSGIGRELALCLSQRGLKVHALARTDTLSGEGLPNLKSHIVDIRDTPKLLSVLNGINADILVNNAGIAPAHAIGKLDSYDVSSIINTNLTSVFQILNQILPQMIEAKKGHIINIGSVAGYNPSMSSIYGATKAAVHMMTKNLRLETKGTGIRVSEISAGIVDTNIIENALRDPEASAKAKKDFGIKILNTVDIAEAVLFALNAPLHVNIGSIEITPVEQSFGASNLTPALV